MTDSRLVRPGVLRMTRRTMIGTMAVTLVLGRAARAETAADEWPRSFTHAFGEATLKQPATRVVSLGYTTQDSLLALGVVPLAVRYWYGDQPYAVWPWASDLLGDAQPVVLTGESGIETVAALQPDLIIGIGSGLSQAEYDLLSQLAPVIMHDPGEPVYGMGWERLTRVLGRATGKDAEAEALITSTEAAFAAARARHPDWAGKTAAAAYHFNGETGAYVGGDGRAAFLTSLGFALPPKLAAYSGDSFYTAMSPEDLSALDADVLMWLETTNKSAELAALPMRRMLNAYKQGGEVYAAGLASVALSFGSILSMPYALELLEGDITAAADGDPATTVPSAVEAGLTK